MGFPCNQFGAQEPGGADEIAAFCQRNYGVGFLMAEKVEVNGPGAHPLFPISPRSAARRAGQPGHEVEFHQVPGGSRGSPDPSLRPDDFTRRPG